MVDASSAALAATTSCEVGDAVYASDSIALSVFFLVGLLGGAHCIGMCGPLVALYSDRMDAESPRSDVLDLPEVKQHFLFNLGRTTSYAVLGAAFGFAGSLVFLTPRSVGAVVSDVRAVAGVVVGVVVVVVGLGYLYTGTSVSVVPGGWSARLSRGVHGYLAPRVDSWVGDHRIVGLGAVHGLLPCPLLYPAYLYSFVQGSPSAGAASLAALGAGTFPAVFLTGTLLQTVGVGGRAKLHRVLGVAFVALGYVPLQHGLASLGVQLPHPPIPYYQPL